jgi:hypothetical protein
LARDGPTQMACRLEGESRGARSYGADRLRPCRIPVPPDDEVDGADGYSMKEDKQTDLR